MIYAHAIACGLVVDRHAFFLDAHRMVIALVLPGDILGVGLFFDGELVWMTDRPAGEA